MDRNERAIHTQMIHECAMVSNCIATRLSPASRVVDGCSGMARWLSEAGGADHHNRLTGREEAEPAHRHRDPHTRLRNPLSDPWTSVPSVLIRVLFPRAHRY